MSLRTERKVLPAISAPLIHACMALLLGSGLGITSAHADNLYWDFAPGTANGASNGGGTTANPGDWFAANTWDRGTGPGYQNWADGNDAFLAGASALQFTGNVTANTLNITSGKVIIQSDAAANNHLLTLTNGGTIASSASVTFGGELVNGAGNERSLDVRLGGDINTSGTFGGNLDLFGGSILSSNSTTSRNIYANVRIGTPQGNTAAAVFGDSSRTGSLLIQGNLSTFGGNRTIEIVTGTTVDVAGTFNLLGGMTVVGNGTLKVAAITTNSSANGFTLGSGTQTTTLELGGAGVMTSTGSPTGTFANNISLNSANTTLRLNSSFATSASPGVQTLSGIISGTGKLVQQGTGRIDLTNTNSYTGTTTVSGGTLALSGSGTTGTGSVTVHNSGTLLGTGIVRGSTFTAQSGSVIHAGDGSLQTSYGTLNFTPTSGSGSFDFQSGSKIVLGINPGGSGDLLNFDGLASGTLLFNGNLQVTAPAGYVPSSPQTFNLMDWANVSTVSFASHFTSNLLRDGSLDDASGFDLPDISGSGYQWDLSQFTTNGTISVSQIPEPGRPLLLLAAIAGLAMRRRRPCMAVA